ncbi:MAG: hypothetical protein FWB99_02585 [Treponema sp.]|nr:hypothetical protein [Treponema sp.]
MKKVLIGLLVLAVAGGGVFAQEWQFNGEMRAGLGMLFTESGDDPHMGMVSEATGGWRTDLRARVANADGTAGLDFLFRTQEDWASAEVRLPHAFGWINFMDNMFTLQGGRIDDAAGFNSFDRMTGQRMGEGFGLRTIVRPLGDNNLMLSFGVYTNQHAPWMFLDHNDPVLTGTTASPVTHASGQAKYTFAAVFTEPGLFRVVGGLRNTNEAGGGYDGWVTGAANVRPGGRTQASAAYLSFEYLALNSDGIHLAASAFFMNLEEFGDYGDFRLYVSAGHTGLVDGMDLRLGVGFGMHMADRLGTGPASYEPSPYLWIWGSVDYQLTDNVVPRLDVHYVMGGRTNQNFRNMNHRDVARAGVTFNEDDSFLRLQPSVQFRVQSNTFVELGAIINVCLGDNATWIPNTAAIGAQSARDNNGVNAAAYALMRVSF